MALDGTDEEAMFVEISDCDLARCDIVNVGTAAVCVIEDMVGCVVRVVVTVFAGWEEDEL